MNALWMNYIDVRNSWFIVIIENIWSAYDLDRTSIEYIDDHRFACCVMRNSSKYVACQRIILVFVLLHDLFIASSCFRLRVDEDESVWCHSSLTLCHYQNLSVSSLKKLDQSVFRFYEAVNLARETQNAMKRLWWAIFDAQRKIDIEYCKRIRTWCWDEEYVDWY